MGSGGGPECLVEIDKETAIGWARKALERVNKDRRRNTEELMRQHQREMGEYESKSRLGRAFSSKPKWPPQEFVRVAAGVILKTPWRRHVIEHGMDVEKLAEECVAACETEGVRRVLLSAKACRKLRKWAE